MLVLGIDPGTATTGFGLVAQEHGQEKLVKYGVIRTSPGLAMEQRLLQIYQEFNALAAEYCPDAVAVEELFHHKNAKTFISVAQSRGVILMATANLGMELAEYTPLQVKQAVVGYGNADKRQVQLMVQKILAMHDQPKPDDAADALAVAICHIHSRRMKNLVKGGVKL
jgi:crossover junction endodeoxyribonuclease RuvC